MNRALSRFLFSLFFAAIAVGINFKTSAQNARAQFEEMLIQTPAHPLACSFMAHQPDYFMSEDCPPKFQFLNKPLIGGYFQSTDIHNRESSYYDLLLKDDCKRYFLLSALSDYYFLLADSLLAAASLPAEYKFLMLTQSGLNPHFEKDKKAGLWGLNAAEAARYGLWVDDSMDERFLSQASTRAAVAHLSYLHSELGGKTHLVVMAFARGMLRVKQSNIDQAGNQWTKGLSEEELEYLAFFSAAVRVWASLPLSNMRPALLSLQWNYSEVKCDTVISMARVAEVLMLDKASLMKRNLHLPLGQYDPARKRSYFSLEKEFIPSFHAQYSIIKKPAPKPIPEPVEEEIKITHVVKRGDVLGAIAAKYGVRISDLQAWNGLKRDVIYVGQKLKIYAEKPVKSQDESVPTVEYTEHVFYKVKNGDTLWAISQKHKNVTPEEIMEMNGIGEKIRPGQTLKIPKK